MTPTPAPNTHADPQATQAVGGADTPLVEGAALQRFVGSESERRERTRAMFDAGASGYDKAEWLTGLGAGPWYRRRVLKKLGVKPGDKVLDVAIGTGLVAVEIDALIQPGGELVGLDPSLGMLAEAKRKLDIETVEGYAESIPLEDGRFDAVTMGYALRHLGSMDRAFSEYLRVLRPGGRVCIMEISKPNGRVTTLLAKAYIRGLVPMLSRLSGEKREVGTLWKYYWDTIQTCIDSDAIVSAMRDAGFEDVRYETTLGVFKEYLGTKPSEACKP